ncbi:MAG: hypothetical protein D6741_18465 [Planctomycetota bacterium]|nr:MAG: hypothetical protein D6741_18465 [Planctomycetota bacterium]
MKTAPRVSLVSRRGLIFARKLGGWGNLVDVRCSRFASAGYNERTIAGRRRRMSAATTTKRPTVPPVWRRFAVASKFGMRET